MNGRAQIYRSKVLTKLTLGLSLEGCHTEKGIYIYNSNMNTKRQPSSSDYFPSANPVKSKDTTPTNSPTREEMALRMNSMHSHETNASARIVAKNRGHRRRMDLRCIDEDNESFRRLMTHPFHTTRMLNVLTSWKSSWEGVSSGLRPIPITVANEMIPSHIGASTAIRFVTVGGLEPLTIGEMPLADVPAPSRRCYRHCRSHIVFC
jgi:hypothetical protein